MGKFASFMDKQTVIFRDLGKMDYKTAWDYQEQLLQENVRIKSGVGSQESGVGSRESVVASRELLARRSLSEGGGVGNTSKNLADEFSLPDTQHYLLFVEHPPVYTLGKSGNIDNVLLGEQELVEKGI